MRQKRYIKCMLSGILALLFVAACGSAVFAADFVETEIAVVKILRGNVPKDVGSFTFELFPQSANAPMPQDCDEDGTKRLILSRTQENGSFGKISFSKAGVHTYTIREVKGDDERCVYDDTVYTLKVYVLNDDGILDIVTTLLNETTGKKHTAAEFTNVYEGGGVDPSETTPGTSTEPSYDPTANDPDPTNPSTSPSVSDTTKFIPTPPGGDVGDSGQGSGPKTGDETNVMVWAAAMFVSVMVFSGLIIADRKKKQSQDK